MATDRDPWRMLVGVGQRNASVTVLGRARAHPLSVAPLAFQTLAQPEGGIGTAQRRGLGAGDSCRSAP